LVQYVQRTYFKPSIKVIEYAYLAQIAKCKKRGNLMLMLFEEKANR